MTIVQRAKVIGVCTVNLFFELVGAANSIGHYVVGVVAMDDANTFQYYFTELYFQHSCPPDANDS